MIRKRNILFDWLFPPVWTMVMYNVLRVISDLAGKGPFWHGDFKSHIIAITLTLLICYTFSFIWRHRLRLADGSNASALEYLYVFLELFVALNFILVVGESIGLLSRSNWINHLLINTAYIPLLLLFYTLIRNNIINKNSQDKMLMLERLKAEKTEAELNFLKSQYHPHFLFNALNTIYFQVDECNEEARQSVAQLSDLLRYQLYDVNKKVTFRQEIQYLRSYILFQQVRKTDKLMVKIDIDAALNTQKIHPLLFQPLVENAFKHVSGSYEISLTLKLIDNQVHCVLKNSIAPKTESKNKKDSGIGVENLKRRLELLYPNRYYLNLNKDNDYFIAELTLNLD
jgi:two-component system, LytTR family, sensor kinase